MFHNKVNIGSIRMQRELEVFHDLVDWGIKYGKSNLAAQLLDELTAAHDEPKSFDHYRSDDYLSLHPYQGVLDGWQSAQFEDGDLDGEEEAFEALGRVLQYLPGAIPAWFHVVWFGDWDEDPSFRAHNSRRAA